MTTSRVESEINSCITRRWSAVRLAQNGVQRGDDGHSQFAQQRQNVTAGGPAENAELVLQADDVHVADVEKIRGAQIGRQVLLLNFEANYFRVLVATLDVVDRHRETLALRMRGCDGRQQVGRERGNAALARQMVADKSDLADFRTFFHGSIFHSSRPRSYADESARQLQMYRLSVKWEGAFSGSVDSVLRAVVFKACGLPIRCGLAGARGGYSRRRSDRLDKPTKLSSV